jgi:hypothetical protein
MSSRRLLALIKRLPEDGAFKTAFNDYDWPLQAHLASGAWNEIKALRSDIWAFIGREHLSYKPILPPSAEQAQAQKRAEARAAHDDLMAQLRGGHVS